MNGSSLIENRRKRDEDRPIKLLSTLGPVGANFKPGVIMVYMCLR